MIQEKGKAVCRKGVRTLTQTGLVLPQTTVSMPQAHPGLQPNSALHLPQDPGQVPPPAWAWGWGAGTEEKSNELMFRVTEYALSLISGKSYSSPKDMTENLIAPCLEYAEKITDMKVTETFVLNALVSVDLAAWQLYSNVNGITSFDKIYKGERKQDLLASIPLITYGTSVDEVKKLAEGGTPLFKIKLGADPDGDGNPEKMLECVYTHNI